MNDDGDEDSTDAPDAHSTTPRAIADARERVIAAMERSAELYGLKRSYGRLYGTLFFADDPVSLDELVDDTGYAKSTVSTAMQQMEGLHLVHRRSIPGEGKKAFFEAETDLWRVVQQFLKHEVKREIDIMTRALEDAEATLEASDHPQASEDLEKIRTLHTLYERSERVVDLLTSSSIERLAGLLDRLRGSN